MPRNKLIIQELINKGENQALVLLSKYGPCGATAQQERRKFLAMEILQLVIEEGRNITIL